MQNGINIMIDEFYKLFYRLEELSLKQDIKCLTMNEVHVIEAIEFNKISMNEISDKLNVTMGTSTTAINSLVKKGFVERLRDEEDRRKVYVCLSSKGFKALDIHRNFHKRIIKVIVKDLENEELKKFASIFNKLRENLEETYVDSQIQTISDFPENQKLKLTEIHGSKGLQEFFYKRGLGIGTIIKIVKKNKDLICILVKDKELEIDMKDSYNLMAIPIDL